MATIFTPAYFGLIYEQRLVIQEEVGLVALVPSLRLPRLDTFLLTYPQLRLQIFGIDFGFPIHGVCVNPLHQDQAQQQRTGHGAFVPVRGQLIHHGCIELPRNYSLRWRLSRLLHYCHGSSKDEDMQMTGSRRSSKPPVPTSSPPGMAFGPAKNQPLSGNPSQRSRGRNRVVRQDLTASTAVGLGNGVGSTKPQATPILTCEQQTDDLNQNRDGVLPHPPASGQCPSLSLPYRAQRSTEPRAPRASPPTPPEDDFSGAQNAQAATQQTAFQSLCPKLKLRRKGHKRTKRLPSQLKGPQNDAQESLPTAAASQPEQHEQTVQRQPEAKLKCTQPAPSAPDQLKQTKSRPRFDAEPSGIRRAAGEPSKRKHSGGRASSRASASGPGRKATHGNQESLDPPSEDDAGSGDDHQAPHPNSQEAPTPKKEARGPFYRCPMHAAKPDGQDGRKCRHWRNDSIAAVTRHALIDAGTGSEKWRQLKNLSSSKLASEERWKRYFLIFNGGVVDVQMDQPYWVDAAPKDQIIDILKIAMARPHLDANPRRSLSEVHDYYGMLTAKEQRDKAIRLQYDQEKRAVEEREAAALRDSQSSFEREVEMLRARIDRDDAPRIVVPQAPDGAVVPHVSGYSQDNMLQGLIPPPETSMHRLSSARESDIEMNTNLEAPLNGLYTDPGALMMPAEAPSFCGRVNPSVAGPSQISMVQRPLTELMDNTDMVMNPNTHPGIRQQLRRQQQHERHQAQMLYSSRYRPYPSDSGLGSSRRSVAGMTSSTNSNQDLLTLNFDNFSSTGNASPGIDIGTGGNTFIDYSQPDAPAYGFGNQRWRG